MSSTWTGPRWSFRSRTSRTGAFIGGAPRCWMWVSTAFTEKARSSRMRLRAMAMSKLPLLVSMTVAVVSTRE